MKILSLLTTLAWIPAFALLLSGCAHPAPHAITLPTATAVAVPIKRATFIAARAAQDNTRAEQLAADAFRNGLRAGSFEAKQLSSFTGATGEGLAQVRVQLATADAAVDKLSAQLLDKQKEVDAQTARVATLTAQCNEAVKTIWWYRERFWGPLVFALVAVGVVVAARFTAWGARTFGPVLVKAEHAAATAAVLA